MSIFFQKNNSEIKTEHLAEADQIISQLYQLNDKTKPVNVRMMTNLLLTRVQREMLPKYIFTLFNRAYEQKEEATLLVMLSQYCRERSDLGLAAQKAQTELYAQLEHKKVAEKLTADLFEILNSDHVEDAINRVWFYRNPYSLREMSSYHADEKYWKQAETHWVYDQKLFNLFAPKDVVAFRKGAEVFFEKKVDALTADKKQFNTALLEKLYNEAVEFWATEDSIFMDIKKLRKDNETRFFSDMLEGASDAVKNKPNDFFFSLEVFEGAREIRREFDNIPRFFTCDAFKTLHKMQQDEKKKVSLDLSL